MSDFGDALGTAVEGGLFAKAIDGRARNQQLEDGHFAEGCCLNCGTELLGSHCHSCGQKAHLHRTIGAFMHDLMHGALHFDGKTWKTLPKLALKPGELTRRYIDGERARFVSPMALFLFTVFAMFAVFQVIGLTAPTNILTDASIKHTFAEIEDRMTSDRDDLRTRLSATSTEMAELESEKATASEEELAELEADIATSKEDRAELEEELVTAERNLAEFHDLRARDMVKVNTSIADVKTGVAFIDKVIDKWNTNPGLMLYKLQANGYKFSWLLIPISIPFVWLLFFWKPAFRTYDHAIFVTYSIAFMSLFFIAFSLLFKTGLIGWLGGNLLLLIPPIHIYKQLRGTYSLSRFSAFWRLSVLLIFINIIGVLFLNLLLVLGAF